jgi:predicted Zn-dependent protease
LPPFIRALSAAFRGTNTVESVPTGIRELEVAAVKASISKDHAKAIELMKQAATLEEQMAPPLGPPILVKPSHELFGEILLRAGKPAEASAQFAVALLRQPNRARSLLGSARAAAQAGDLAGAAAAYAKLIEQWNRADQELAELREARDFVKSQPQITQK